MDERNDIGRAKGLIERVKEAEATEADLIEDIKKLTRANQMYVHDIVKEILDE